MAFQWQIERHAALAFGGTPLLKRQEQAARAPAREYVVALEQILSRVGRLWARGFRFTNLGWFKYR